MDHLKDNPVEPVSCGESVAGHFNRILAVMAMAGGAGVPCPEAYEALVEFTEGFRLAGNHERIEPSENGLGREFAERIAAAARQPDGGAAQIHAAKQRLRETIAKVQQAQGIGEALPTGSGGDDPKDYRNRN